MSVRPPLVRHLLRNYQLKLLQNHSTAKMSEATLTEVQLNDLISQLLKISHVRGLFE